MLSQFSHIYCINVISFTCYQKELVVGGLKNQLQIQHLCTSSPNNLQVDTATLWCYFKVRDAYYQMYTIKTWFLYIWKPFFIVSNCQAFLAACEMGRYGCNCSQVCSTGTYGLNCYHQCYCTGDEVCDPAVGCTNVTTTLSPTTVSQSTAKLYKSTLIFSGNIQI